MTSFFNTPLDGAVDLPANLDLAMAMLVIVHGLAEHRARYRTAIEFFNARGIACCSFDLRGHGQTVSQGVDPLDSRNDSKQGDSKRGDVESFDDFVADVDAIIDGLRLKYPQLPLFVWGHSMGSIVATLAVAERPTKVRGAITSSPPFAAFDSYSKLKKTFLIWLARLFPARKMALPVNPDRLSRDADVGRVYSADPLIPKAVSLRLLVGLALASERGLLMARKLRTPWLLLHGGSDRVAPPIGSQRLLDALAGTDKQIMFWPAARHEVHNELEPERTEFFTRIAEWISERSVAVRN